MVPHQIKNIIKIKLEWNESCIITEIKYSPDELSGVIDEIIREYK